MSSAVQAVIDAYDRLTYDERREAAYEILKRRKLRIIHHLTTRRSTESPTSLSSNMTSERRSMSSPERGEVWMVDLGYVAKYRPSLVFSIKPLDTDRALTTVIPHTTSTRGSRFEIAIGTSFLKPGVFDAQNPISTAKAKFTRKLGALTSDQMGLVEDAVRQWLGL